MKKKVCCDLLMMRYALATVGLSTERDVAETESSWHDAVYEGPIVQYTPDELKSLNVGENSAR